MKIDLHSAHRLTRLAAVVVSFLFLVISCFLQPGTLHAQWTKRNITVGEAYFVEFLEDVGKPNVGFIGRKTSGMLKTTDGGFTWTTVTCNPERFTHFKDIAFKNDQIGWAVGDYATYRTTDGGNTWSFVFAAQAVSVHYIRSTDRVIISSWDRPAQVSDDLGDTWESFGPIEMNGITAIDDRNVLIMPHVNVAMFTTDGGDTWQNGSMWHEVYQPVALKGHRWWIGVSEGPTQEVVKSTNGFNWEVIGTLPLPTGCVRGNDSNLIAQTEKTVYRSTDQGSSWFDICGPLGEVDTRFWVRGTEIFIVSGGVLWYNPTSRTSTDPKSDVVILPNPLELSSDGCFIDNRSLSIQVNVCNGTLQKAELVELTDVGEFAIDDLNLPKTFQGKVLLPVRYIALDDDQDTALVKLTFTLEGKTFDTIIKVYGKRSGAINARGQPQTIVLRMGRDCNPDRQYGEISNLGCDGFTVDSFTLSDPLHFTIEGLDLPQTVPGKAGLGFYVRSRVVTRSRVEASLRVYMHNDAGSRVVLFVLKLVNNDPIVPSLPDAHFTFGTTCEPIDTIMTFTNPMCDTLTVDSVKFGKSDPFALGSLTVPKKLGKNDNFTIPYRVLPPKPGPAATKVTIFYTVLGEPMQRVAWLYSNQSIDIVLPADTVKYVIDEPCPMFDSVFRIGNILCDSIRILSLRPAIQPNYDIVVPATPLALGEDDDIAIGISTDLYTRGTTGTNVKIRYEAYGQIYDTTVYISVRNLSTFKIDPKLKRMNFGRISICAPQQRTVYVKNDYCLPMTIETARWSAATSPTFTILSQPLLPCKLLPGEQDSFTIQFAPITMGSRNGALEMQLTVASIKLDTFMTVEGIGSGSVLANIRDEALSFGTTLTCETLQSTTVVRNDGCEALDLVSLMTPPANFRLVDPSLPYTIEPGDSVLVRFETNTEAPGPHTETVTLRLLSRGNTEQLLDCTLDATLVKEAQRLEFSGLSLDSLSGCATTDTLVTVTNPNRCDTLTLEALFSTTDVELLGGNNIRVPPGESGTFRFRIHPNSGTGTALQLRSLELDTTLPITYSFTAGGAGETVMSVPRTTFSTSACDTVTETYTITNNTCDDITITALELIPVGGPTTRFAITSPIALPYTLNRGATLNIPVVFDPTATGVNTATLSVDGDFTANHQLTGTFTPVQELGVVLASSGLKQVIVGNTIDVDVALSASVTPESLFDEIELEFSYDRDLLSLKGIVPHGGFSIVDTSHIGSGIIVRLQTTSTTFVTGDPVLSLKFGTMLSTTTSGSITLAKMSLVSQDPRYTACILRSLDLETSNDVTVDYLCEDALLLDLLRGERIVKKIQIRPHPVSTSSDRSATLYFESAQESDATIELIDVLGILRWSTDVRIVKGDNTVEMPVTGLTNGWHLLRIATPLGFGSSKILIED